MINTINSPVLFVYNTTKFTNEHLAKSNFVVRKSTKGLERVGDKLSRTIANLEAIFHVCTHIDRRAFDSLTLTHRN